MGPVGRASKDKGSLEKILKAFISFGSIFLSKSAGHRMMFLNPILNERLLRLREVYIMGCYE